MSAITYKHPTDAQRKKGIESVVCLDGKKTGCIFRRPHKASPPHDYQYVPIGKNEMSGGELYGSLVECKHSIEKE